jgi:hypothetical protein
LSFPGYLSGAAQTITIPDGSYEISDLNNYLQYWFISKGLYLTNTTTGLNTYYASFSISPTAYAVELNTTPIPASLPSGYSNGGGITFDGSSNRHPQITILSTNNFYKIIGFNAGTYPSTSTYGTGTYTKLSDIIPDVAGALSSIQMRLSCVYNPFSSNSQLLHCFTPAGTTVGAIINASPIQLQYVPCVGSHKELLLSFFDSQGNVLNILDPNITIKLIFKKNNISE